MKKIKRRGKGWEERTILSLLSPLALFFFSTSCFSFCLPRSKDSLEQAISLEFITVGGPHCKLGRGCGQQ